MLKQSGPKPFISFFFFLLAPFFLVLLLPPFFESIVLPLADALSVPMPEAPLEALPGVLRLRTLDPVAVQVVQVVLVILVQLRLRRRRRLGFGRLIVGAVLGRAGPALAAALGLHFVTRRLGRHFSRSLFSTSLEAELRRK